MGCLPLSKWVQKKVWLMEYPHLWYEIWLYVDYNPRMLWYKPWIPVLPWLVSPLRMVLPLIFHYDSKMLVSPLSLVLPLIFHYDSKMLVSPLSLVLPLIFHYDSKMLVSLLSLVIPPKSIYERLIHAYSTKVIHHLQPRSTFFLRLVVGDGDLLALAGAWNPWWYHRIQRWRNVEEGIPSGND